MSGNIVDSGNGKKLKQAGDGGIARAQTLTQTLENLPVDVLRKLVPDEMALVLCRTSTTMRAAARAASVSLVVQAKPDRKFSDGLGLLAELNGFSPLWTVKVLRLRACDLRAEGGKALAKFLKENTTLTELDLGSNSLQEAGGLALAAALRENTTLLKLDLRENEMGSRVGVQFAKKLRRDVTLRCLNISSNQLDQKAIGEFVYALTLNQTLTSLALGGHDLRGGGALGLITALLQNETLTELDLYNSMFHEKDVCRLVEALCRNTTLATLDLRAASTAEGLVAGIVLAADPALGARVLYTPGEQTQRNDNVDHRAARLHYLMHS